MKAPMHPQFAQLMKDATALTRSGDLQAAMAAISTALSHGPAALPAAANDVIDAAVIDVEARVIHSDPPARPAAETAAQFISGHFTHRAGARDYRLYIPPTRADKPRAPVLLLP